MSCCMLVTRTVALVPSLAGALVLATLVVPCSLLWGLGCLIVVGLRERERPHKHRARARSYPSVRETLLPVALPGWEAPLHPDQTSAFMVATEIVDVRPTEHALYPCALPLYVQAIPVDTMGCGDWLDAVVYAGESVRAILPVTHRDEQHTHETVSVAACSPVVHEEVSDETLRHDHVADEDVEEQMLDNSAGEELTPYQRRRLALQDGYGAMSWNALRAYAKQRGVRTTGKRSEVEARLLDHEMVQQEPHDSVETPAVTTASGLVLSALSYPELQRLAKGRGLKATGKRADLEARIQQDDELRTSEAYDRLAR